MLATLAEHWPLKVLSVACAAALWLFVTSTDRGEAVLSLPLELVDRPGDVEVTALAVEAVSVRVEGRRMILGRVREQDFRAEVSLRGGRPGPFLGRVAVRGVSAPRGVRVVRVVPAQVRVTLEARGS
jgi:YbbR domain-containing protein